MVVGTAGADLWHLMNGRGKGRGDVAGGSGEAVPEREPPSRVDEAHKSRLLVGEALSAVGGVIQVLMNLVADLRAWCALLESRANGRGPGTATSAQGVGRPSAATGRRGGAACQGAPGPRGRRGARVVTGRSASTTRGPTRSGHRTVRRAQDAAGALRECDRVLESADEQLDAFEAQLAAVRAQLEAERGAGRQNPVTDAVPAAVSAPVDMRKTPAPPSSPMTRHRRTPPRTGSRRRPGGPPG